MKFTVFPDMDAKREKIQKKIETRNQKKRDKNDKRRKKYGAKEPVFKLIFLKILAVVLGISVVISILGTYLYREYANAVVEKMYSKWVDDIYASANAQIAKLDKNSNLTNEEKEQQFILNVKLAMINNNESSLFDFSASMYEMDLLSNPKSDYSIVYGEDEYKLDGKVYKVCDSKEDVVFYLYDSPGYNYGTKGDEMCLLFDRKNNLSAEDNKQIMVSNNDCKLNLKESRVEPGEYDVFWCVEDYYVKNNTIKLGKIFSVQTDENGFMDETKKYYDLTPDDTTGYKHIIVAEEDEKRFNGEPSFMLCYQYGGTKQGSFADKATNMCEVAYYQDGTVAVSFENDILTPDNKLVKVFDEFSYSAGPIEWESMGKKYQIVTCGAFNFVDIFMNQLIKVYLLVLCIDLFIALGVSMNIWIRRKAIYDMDEYRRNIIDIMAHDLKSPLMGIAGFAENLKENIHTEKRDYYAEVILKNVYYMNDLIEHILDLSRSETGLKLAIEEIDIQVIMQELLLKYETQIKQKNIKCDIRIEDGFTCKADQQLMKHVFDNLLSNAIKFCNSESTIVIKSSNKTIIIENEYNGRKNELSAAELIQPFVKGEKSRSNESGSGVGLSIVKNILSEHNFKLELMANDNTFSAIIHL